MPDNNGGPWGGGGNKPGGGKGDNPWSKPGSNENKNRPRPSNEPNDIDRLIKDGQAQFRRIMGGGGDGRNGNNGASGGSGNGRLMSLLLIGGIALFWAFMSFHVIRETDNAVVMRFGKHIQTWDDGLHFAPWPIYTIESENVTDQRVNRIGVGNGEQGQDWSLMLTSDEKIIDIEFDVVWKIKDLAAFKFNIEEPRETIHAVAQSSIREVVARSPLMPLLNVTREEMIDEVLALIEQNLDDYNSGIDIVRTPLRKSEPPQEVIADFEDVQAAEQERDKKQSDAQAQGKTLLAQARGQEAQILEDAEGYRAQAINSAEGEAARFTSVLDEYRKAPEVTRRRLYLETMQEVYSEVDKVIVDDNSSQGVVPYLPLNELKKNTSQEGATQ